MTNLSVPPGFTTWLEKWQAFDETLDQVCTSLDDLPSAELDALITKARAGVRKRTE